jgi:hypothetical protein
MRSGSSLATRALALLGLDVGRESDLMEGKPGDNPKGFWEQQPIMDLNEELLAKLGGPWWDMPRLDDGWHEDAELDPLRERACRLVEELFPGARRWVWKDPRASITLPFWQDVIGPMSYVVAARPPAEAAASLEARNPVLHSWRDSTRLYFRLLRESLRHTAGAERIVLFYEDWFEDFDAQLERLGRFALGEEPAEAERSDVREFFEDDLRRHDAAADARELDPEIRDAYALLREGTDEAGRLDADAERAFEERWLAFDERAGEDREDLRARSRMGWALAVARQHYLEGLEARHAEQTAELGRVRGWLDEVNGSASWRLTAPLRAAKRIAGRR